MNIAIAWEAHGPKIIAVFTAFLFFRFGGEAYTFAIASNWNISAIYTSVFDLASIITAFIFGFFTFARTSETEFLFEMRKTETYKRFMRFLVTAMYSTALVSLLSIPLMIAEPKPSAGKDMWFWICLAWFTLVVFSLCATIRSMRQFIAIAMVEKE